MVDSKLSSCEVDQKEYYNRIAEEYDRHYANKYALKYRYGIYDGIFNNVNLKNMHILDAMCGGGQLDISSDMEHSLPDWTFQKIVVLFIENVIQNAVCCALRSSKRSFQSLLLILL